MVSTNDISRFINQYSAWIQGEIESHKLGDFYEVTLPFLDRFNDYLQVYIKLDTDNKITITDDGYIINNLLASGFTFPPNSNKLKELHRIARTFGVEIIDNAIVATTEHKHFPQKKHAVIQAMLKVDDMYQVQPEKPKSIIVDKVENFFRTNEFSYSSKIYVAGKTGTHHLYDFLFTSTKNQPERYCKILDSAQDNQRNLIIFNWIDTVQVRKQNSRLIVITNDEKVHPSSLQAFKEYDIKPVAYSHLEEERALFAA